MSVQRIFAAIAIVVVVGAVFIAAPADAAERQADLFGQGSMRISILAGSGSAFGENYTIIGAGFGYYVLDGLEAGLEYEAWLGGDRTIRRVSPLVTYVFPLPGNARPYAGLFYRRAFIEQYRDLNDAGACAGILFLYGRKAYLGVGAAYERHLACDAAVYDSCSQAYPELTVAFLF